MTILTGKRLEIQEALLGSNINYRPKAEDFERFTASLKIYLEKLELSRGSVEEEAKALLIRFLSSCLPDYEIIPTERLDICIRENKKSDYRCDPEVIIECKRPSETKDFIQNNNLNCKAFQQAIYYYLEEGSAHNNCSIKNIIVTNYDSFYIFDEVAFNKCFGKINNKKLAKIRENWITNKRNTDEIYSLISTYLSDDLYRLNEQLHYVYFDMATLRNEILTTSSDPSKSKYLVSIFKLLSKFHLLKAAIPNIGNTLNKRFYDELLHIIGLEEVSKNGKMVIRRRDNKFNYAPLIESIINQNKEKFNSIPSVNQDDKAIELVITWVNRILFLKLLEAQLIRYHSGNSSFSFLNKKLISNWDHFNKLFFDVLAIPESKRNLMDSKVKEFSLVPYLNSSLFELSDIEILLGTINNLAEVDLEPYHKTILKDKNGKKRTKPIRNIDYLLEFLDAYDFGSKSQPSSIVKNNETLINASVLGLVFEKINGYKEGSFYTPSSITTYMCRDVIRLALLEKLNKGFNWQCQNWTELQQKCRNLEHASIKHANTIINSLKICDPSVGSGHFLVSALNELIAIKSELGILLDINGDPLKLYLVINVTDDELSIIDRIHGEFAYEVKSYDSYTHRREVSQYASLYQQTVFNEKKLLIENSLYGTDINPTSVNICRLRLWIELLKNTYYKPNTNYCELETLPNIDINIKCGNSLISKFGLTEKLNLKKDEKKKISELLLLIKKYHSENDKTVKKAINTAINEMKQSLQIKCLENTKAYAQRKAYRAKEQELEQVISTAQTFLNQKAWVAELPSIAIKEKEAMTQAKKELVKVKAQITERDKLIQNMAINPAFKNAFEWRYEFPEVLHPETADFVGFDIVLGNPPWGSLLSKEEKVYLKESYKNIDSSTPNSFAYFVGLAFNISTHYVAYVLPDSILIKDYAKTRSLLKPFITDLCWYQNIGLPDEYKSFPEVEHDVCVFIAGHKRVDDIKTFMKCYSSAEKQVKLISSINKKKDIMVDEFDNVFNLMLGDKDLAILNKLKKHRLIGEFLQCHEGIHTGNSRDLLFKPAKENMYCMPLFYGGGAGDKIFNYCSKRSGWYVDYRKELINENKGAYASLRDERIFTEPKIYITRTGKPFKAFFDTDSYASNNFFSLQFKDYEQNKADELKVILPFVVSNLAQYFIRTFAAPRIGNTFVETKITHLLKFRIPVLDKEIKEVLLAKVNNIIELKSLNLNADTVQLEKDLDASIYRLYDLTYEEVLIVDSQFALDREQYLALSIV